MPKDPRTGPQLSGHHTQTDEEINSPLRQEFSISAISREWGNYCIYKHPGKIVLVSFSFRSCFIISNGLCYHPWCKCETAVVRAAPSLLHLHHLLHLQLLRLHTIHLPSLTLMSKTGPFSRSCDFDLIKTLKISVLHARLIMLPILSSQSHLSFWYQTSVGKP